MFDMKNIGKMIEPMIKPMLDEFKPKLNAFLEAFAALDSRTKRMEPAIQQLQRDSVLAHEKLNAILEELKNGRGNPPSADGKRDGDDAGDSTGTQPPGAAG